MRSFWIQPIVMFGFSFISLILSWVYKNVDPAGSIIGILIAVVAFGVGTVLAWDNKKLLEKYIAQN